MGIIIIGKIRTARLLRDGLVILSMIAAPINMKIFRKAIEAEEPTTVLINVVSAVSRDSTSPVFVTSKKDGLSFVICE
jgi:uncharacterized protein (UPF0333 family)